MKTKFCLLILMVFLFGGNALSAETPFIYEKGYIIVPAKIKKDVVVELVVNTGLDVSYVDTASAEKNKIRLSYTGIGVVTGRDDKIAFFSEVPDLIIGTEKTTSLFMEASTLDNLKKSLGREIFGILGNDFFKGKSVKFDFKNKTLSFLSQSDADKSSKSPAAQFSFTCQMGGLITNKFGKEIIFPVCNDVVVNGKKVKALFDLGSRIPISILPSGAKILGLDAPEKSQTKDVEVKSLKFSDYEMNDLPSVLLGKDTVSEQYRNSFDAIIGINILQNFTITFDFKKKTIIIEQ